MGIARMDRDAGDFNRIVIQGRQRALAERGCREERISAQLHKDFGAGYKDYIRPGVN